MITHVQELSHGSGTLHSMGSHDWLLREWLPNMASKRWHQYLRVSQPRNAAPINYQVAPALSGGCVSGCSCWRAPVPVSLGASGSNPLQVCDRQRSDACTHTSSERVQQWHANESFCMVMCHGSPGEAGSRKRCSALECIAEKISNALQSGASFPQARCPRAFARLLELPMLPHLTQ